MNKKQFLFALILQFLFLVDLSPQTNYDRFMLMWYDYSTINTHINIISQRYKDMKMDHNKTLMNLQQTNQQIKQINK